MAEMQEMELTVTIGNVHKTSPRFNACKIADKRVADLISDCSKLSMNHYVKILLKLKQEINDKYIEAADFEATRIRRELQ